MCKKRKAPRARKKQQKISTDDVLKSKAETLVGDDANQTVLGLSVSSNSNSISISICIIGILIATFFCQQSNVLVEKNPTVSIHRNDDDGGVENDNDFGDGNILLSHNNNDRQDSSPCAYYMARSTIPNSGLGIFTAEHLKKGAPIGGADGDINIILPDPTLNPIYASALQTLFFDYIWGGAEVGAMYEGQKVYAIIPGVGMLANGHRTLHNIKQPNGPTVDHSGLKRDVSPGAGASSHYHNYSFVSSSDIEAGSEILVHYGEQWFEERERKNKIRIERDNSTDGNIDRTGTGTGTGIIPKHKQDVNWLRENGMCIDNIKIGISTIPDAGRGAFANRYLKKGSVVSPAPVVQILNKKSLEQIRIKQDEHGREQHEIVEQLLLNYCYGSQDSSLLFFPYAPMVNYINHNTTANVELRWSRSSHHNQRNVDEMTIEDIHGLEHGGLMLEFVATRDIEEDEEIFLYYGSGWEEAWRTHASQWEAGEEHSYTFDLDDNTPIIRTQREQEVDPYPPHIFTSCYYSYKHRRRDGRGQFVWSPITNIYQSRNLRPCIIIKRHGDMENNVMYTVAMRNRFGLDEVDRIPRGEMHVVSNLPRSAIKFSSKIFTTDMHMPNAFRHHIELSNDIFPPQWKDLQH